MGSKGEPDAKMTAPLLHLRKPHAGSEMHARAEPQVRTAGMGSMQCTSQALRYVLDSLTEYWFLSTQPEVPWVHGFPHNAESEFHHETYDVDRIGKTSPHDTHKDPKQEALDV
jgi:hypothetical protein